MLKVQTIIYTTMTYIRLGSLYPYSLVLVCQKVISWIICKIHQWGLNNDNLQLTLFQRKTKILFREKTKTSEINAENKSIIWVTSTQDVLGTRNLWCCSWKRPWIPIRCNSQKTFWLLFEVRHSFPRCLAPKNWCWCLVLGHFRYGCEIQFCHLFLRKSSRQAWKVGQNCLRELRWIKPMSTWCLVSPPYFGPTIIFHKGNFLKLYTD